MEWTEQKDEILSSMKAAGKAWRTICAAVGCTKDEGQRRLAAIKASKDGKVRVAEPEEPPFTARDGIGWLLRKRRITPAQAAAAQLYRQAFIEAVEAGAAIHCSLDFDITLVRNPGVMARIPGDRHGSLEAKRTLFRYRFDILRGQTDMLTVMDGVCGQGWTPRELAKGDGYRASQLEAVLKVALDLIGGLSEGMRTNTA